MLDHLFQQLENRLGINARHITQLVGIAVAHPAYFAEWAKEKSGISNTKATPDESKRRSLKKDAESFKTDILKRISTLEKAQSRKDTSKEA